LCVTIYNFTKDARRHGRQVYTTLYIHNTEGTSLIFKDMRLCFGELRSYIRNGQRLLVSLLCWEEFVVWRGSLRMVSMDREWLRKSNWYV